MYKITDNGSCKNKAASPAPDDAGEKEAAPLYGMPGKVAIRQAFFSLTSLLASTTLTM